MREEIVIGLLYREKGKSMKNSNWGGKRQGAGRKKSPIERHGRTFRLTDEEFKIVLPIIMGLRKETEQKALQGKRT